MNLHENPQTSYYSFVCITQRLEELTLRTALRVRRFVDSCRESPPGALRVTFTSFECHGLDRVDARRAGVFAYPLPIKPQQNYADVIDHPLTR